MPTLRQPLQITLRLLRCGSVAARHRVALCAMGAKAVQYEALRLVAVRAALQRSAGTEVMHRRARCRCIAAARLCMQMKNGGWSFDHPPFL
jgi:hypothetical protein